MIRYNPFNPQQPARPDFFVGREPEITEFEKHLSQTIHGSPMNMAITGNKGMGKTSVLMKFEDIGRRNECLTLRLSNYDGNVKNIVDFTDYITANLKREILSRKPVGKKIENMKDWIDTLKPTIGWKDARLTVERQQVVQEMFRERLARLWNETKEEYKAILLLIDEAESLESVEGILTFLREVLQRISTEQKYMVVLAGKLNFPERMSESFSPLNRFFPSSRLAPFNEDEVRSYIIRKLATVDVGIDDDVLQRIAKRCEGHPYVLVAMCYLLFDSLEEKETHLTEGILHRSEEKINARLAQDFFSPMYRPLTPRAKEILLKIASNIKGLEFTFNEAVEWTEKPKNFVSPYFKELLRKGVLNKPERGRYQIFHTLFLEYLKKVAEEGNQKSR